MDDQLTQIPEGDYMLRFEFHETKRIFKSEKIYLHSFVYFAWTGSARVSAHTLDKILIVTHPKFEVK